MDVQFLFEAPVANSVDDTVKELTEIWNMQIQVSPTLSFSFMRIVF
jgi:hypothetical protein